MRPPGSTSASIWLPDAVTLDADLSRAFTMADVGERGDELRRRRVLLDAPFRYC